MKLNGYDGEEMEMVGKLLKSQKVLLILLVILLIPTFIRMIRPGIFSMHDFHLIRLHEYHKCVLDLQIPCRWAADLGLGYGQPLFNFYTQLPYLFGEIFRLFNFSAIDTLKILFILSIVLSGITMFFLSKQLWGSNLAGLVSALIYSYAPYRSVDIWVRGALPEALSFIFFPLITYFFNVIVFNKSTKFLLLFVISFAGLILTHNLSVIMYLIFLVFWGVYLLTLKKAWNLVPKFLLGGILIIGLASFYIIPVIFESKLISIGETTGGYYDFANHYVTLKQLLISRYWGYGASLWGEDDRLSLSVGLVQWMLPIIVAVVLLMRRSIKKNLNFFIIFFIGWFFLFLTHNKSTILWQFLPGIKFIQFPWRFLSLAVFSFALSSGILFSLSKKLSLKSLFALVILISLIVLNVSLFREDIWYYHNDKDEFSGDRLKFHLSSAPSDFWPKTAKNTPVNLAPENALILEGSGSGVIKEKRSNRVTFEVLINSDKARIQFPLVYFPGWHLFKDEKYIDIYPFGDLGLITADLTKGYYNVVLKFKDTPVRSLSNLITMFSILVLTYYALGSRTKFKNDKND